MINKVGGNMSNYTQATPATKTTPSKGRILRMKQLLEKIPFTASHIYGLIKEDKFPKPFQLIPNGRAKGWHESVIDQWISENMRSQ
jgi:prophage regulatory protein